MSRTPQTTPPDLHQQVAAEIRRRSSGRPCSHPWAQPTCVDSSTPRARRSAPSPAASIPDDSTRWGWPPIYDLDPVTRTIEITLPDTRFPRDIEAAADFTCVEALTNVAKYANATHASVLVCAADGKLIVEIADNGRGGADTANGTGLLGLQDRLDVLGGVLAVHSSSQGTRIRCTIPLPPL